jgi:(2R)-3-sulfolactate dehydrogenase (NADP+)
MSDRTLTLDEARALVARTLERCRTSAANAAAVARALVAAEADGLKGHGLSRLPSYAAQAKVGKVDGFSTPIVSQPRPALVLVDAAAGFAYPALDAARAPLMEAARREGIAAAAVRRSHHCGAAGHMVEALAGERLVALFFANTPAAIAPWGGKRGLYGTDPIAFACPLPDQEPLVVDLSLSKVARGNILAAKQKGERIPEGWALNVAGSPTTDPSEALAGTMVPIGEAKGTVLALMVELLAAGLTGANYASEASSFLDAEGPPPGTGQLIIAFDPTAIGGKETIGRFAALAAMIEAEPGARLPGRRRLTRRAAAEANGVTIAQRLFEEIEAL